MKRILFVLVFFYLKYKEKSKLYTTEDIPCCNITGVINISSSVTSLLEFVVTGVCIPEFYYLGGTKHTSAEDDGSPS